MKHRKYTLLIGVLVAFSAVLVGTVLMRGSALADQPYTPSDLISNQLFINSGSMNPTDIQTFLTQENSGIAGLKDTETCDSYDSGWYAHCGQTLSAAQLIYDAGQVYGISPRVILATMQKEEALVTDPSPTQSAINCAMGYTDGYPYCYQSPAQGFFNQVDWGTYTLRYNYEGSLQHATWLSYHPAANYPCANATSLYSLGLYPGNTVTFADPGGVAQTITLANAATASLYCYTPYVGPYSVTGYSGSYNFVQSYENWWGTTTGPFITTGLTITPSNPVVGQPIEVKFIISNDGNTDIGVGGMIVAVRGPNNINKDYGLVNNVIVPANSTYTYDETQVFSVPGSYKFFISNYGAGQWWYNYPPSASTSISQQANVYIAPNPLITTGLTLSPASPVVGEPITASFTITNQSNTVVGVGGMIVAVRDSHGVNKDYGFDSNVMIPGNGTYTYSMPQVFTKPGTYTAFISNYGAGQWWSNYPASASSSIPQQLTFNVNPNPLITTGLTVIPSNPAVGQSVEVKFTITNSGSTDIGVGGMIVAVRDPTGANKDYAFASNVVVPANGAYTYDASQVFTVVGKYKMFISNYGAGQWWSNYPASANSSVVQQATVNIGP